MTDYQLIKSIDKRKLGGEMKKLIRFFKDEEGVTSIEYGFIALIMTLALLASATLVGQWVGDTFGLLGSLPKPG